MSTTAIGRQLIERLASLGICDGRAKRIKIVALLKKLVRVEYVDELGIEQAKELPIIGWHFAQGMLDLIPAKCREFSIEAEWDGVVEIRSISFCSAEILDKDLGAMFAIAPAKAIT